MESRNGENMDKSCSLEVVADGIGDSASVSGEKPEQKSGFGGVEVCFKTALYPLAECVEAALGGPFPVPGCPVPELAVCGEPLTPEPFAGVESPGHCRGRDGVPLGLETDAVSGFGERFERSFFSNAQSVAAVRLHDKGGPARPRKERFDVAASFGRNFAGFVAGMQMFAVGLRGMAYATADEREQDGALDTPVECPGDDGYGDEQERRITRKIEACVYGHQGECADEGRFSGQWGGQFLQAG